MQNADISIGGDKFLSNENIENVEITPEMASMIEAQNEMFSNPKSKDGAEMKVNEEILSEVTEELEMAEIKPLGSLVMVKPYPINPYSQMQITENGVVVASDMPTKKKSEDSGELEDQEAFIIVGKVQEVGPEVKNVIIGDDVFYTKPSETPVPFLKLGMYVVPESRILAIVNSNLSNRF